MLDDIRSELRRVGVRNALASLDREFEPNAGELIKFEMHGAYWHFLPNHFLELLRELPDHAGNSALQNAIEAKATFTWHGPSPEGSRDTSA